MNHPPAKADIRQTGRQDQRQDIAMPRNPQQAAADKASYEETGGQSGQRARQGAAYAQACEQAQGIPDHAPHAGTEHNRQHRPQIRTAALHCSTPFRTTRACPFRQLNKPSPLMASRKV